MIVYHASNNKFDHPTYLGCLANRTGHENGALGLWFALSKEIADRFGQYTYSFNLDAFNVDSESLITESARFEFKGVALNRINQNNDLKIIPLTELVSWARDTSFNYSVKRAQLLAEGFSLLLITEVDDIIYMGVVLDFNSIQNFTET